MRPRIALPLIPAEQVDTATQTAGAVPETADRDRGAPPFVVLRYEVLQKELEQQVQAQRDRPAGSPQGQEGLR